MDFGLLVLRLVVGALFIGHGTQKLFGWFGGYGVEGTGGFMESLGYRPGKPHGDTNQLDGVHFTDSPFGGRGTKIE